MFAKPETYNGLDCSQFVFQTMCEFLDGQLTELLFVFETFGKLAIVALPPTR